MTIAEPSGLPNALASKTTNEITHEDLHWKAASAAMYAAPVAALGAVGLGAAGLLGVGPRLLSRHPVVSAALTCGGIAVLIKSQFDRYLLQSPDYTVVESTEAFEVRDYAPRVVAETVVYSASFDEAREEGFRRLADYIFGGNSPGEKLPMTTPVHLGKKENGGERLAMTTPVTLEQSGAAYVMRFLMPKERPLDTLPQPTDSRVTLRTLESERVAVTRFRGTYDGERIAEKEQELLSRVVAHGLTPCGEPAFAGYDSPATLPFIRRIEVWVSVERDA